MSPRLRSHAMPPKAARRGTSGVGLDAKAPDRKPKTTPHGISSFDQLIPEVQWPADVWISPRYIVFIRLLSSGLHDGGRQIT